MWLTLYPLFTTIAVCSHCSLNCGCLYHKQFGPRLDCPWSSLIRAKVFDSVSKLVLYAFEHICIRCKKQMAFSGMRESRKFFRWDPTLTFSFLVDDERTGEMISIPLKMAHHLPASKMPFKWSFADVRMKAQH